MISQGILVRLPDVQKMTGLRRSQIYALARKDSFPKPVKLSERCSAWVQSEVSQWIDERISASRGQRPAN